MAHQTVADEQYVFKPSAKKWLYILLVVGIALFGLGLLLAMNEGEGHGGEHHGSLSVEKQMVASIDQHEEHGTATDEHQEAKEEGHHAEAAGEAHGGGHHGSPTWLKRLYTTLWMNNIYFIGLGLIGLFFVAIQYAAQAGWSAGVLRIPVAMGSWIPVAGILTLVLWFVVKGDVFHWTHGDLYVEGGEGFDKIIAKKAPFFFFPLAGGAAFPAFYLFRMVLFFAVWYMFFVWIRKNMVSEDLDGDVKHWYKNQINATVFLIFFGVSSSVAAWDWVMSIDTHWFSTMFGWYVFASWWVTGLTMIALIVVHLKSAGYLKVVNSNHIHDLGKFIFAFSIFWTYIWFGQFLLIYYANIPEETVYFIERMRTSPYSWIFYTNLILNFVLPFLLLMTRDAKRQVSMLKVVCPIVILGHWFDFYNMVTPGVMKLEGGIGFLEIGVALIFFAVYFLVVLNSLTKIPLIGKNHPMLQESLHHHI
jgi:hypothetical protein